MRAQFNDFVFRLIEGRDFSLRGVTVGSEEPCLRVMRHSSAWGDRDLHILFLGLGDGSVVSGRGANANY